VGGSSGAGGSVGGNYGGGGGGSDNLVGVNAFAGAGAGGAVRIMWAGTSGTLTRVFPSTNTANM
jgi:hypothetical protein